MAQRELASNRVAGRAKAVTRHNTRTRPVRVGEHHLKDWLSPAESRARRRRRGRRGTTSDPAVGYDARSTSARSASASSPRRRRRRCRRRQSHGHEQASGRRRRRCLPHAAPRQRVTLEFESALRQNVSNSSPDARAGERASPWALRRRGGHVVCYLGRRRVPSVARKVSQVTPRSRPCYRGGAAASARTCRGLEIRRPRFIRSWTGLAQAPVCGSRRASGAPTSDERRGGVRELFVSYYSRPAVEQQPLLFRTDRAPRANPRRADSMCRSTQSPAKALATSSKYVIEPSHQWPVGPMSRG